MSPPIRLVRPPSPTSLARIVNEKCTTIPDRPISHIKGDASDNVKALVSQLLWFYEFAGEAKDRFADQIGLRIKTKEIGFLPSPEPPQGSSESAVSEGSSQLRRNVQMICELDVTGDMTNIQGTLHGGCASYLIDGTTSLILVAHSMMTTGAPTARVSQQMNVTFHAPVLAGNKLRIVCYTISVGKRTATAACELWDASNNRLAVSGSQIMMQASLPGAPKPRL